MVAFNTTLIKTWKLAGYRFIHVLPRDKYGVLRPLTEDKPVKKGYTIQLHEISLLQLAEDYFITKEKDAYLRAGSCPSAIQ